MILIGSDYAYPKFEILQLIKYAQPKFNYFNVLLASLTTPTKLPPPAQHFRRKFVRKKSVLKISQILIVGC
jgi:hypothetical protein